MDKLLNKIYRDPSNPGGFGSLKRLYNEAKKQIPDITLSRVKDFLQGQEAYTKHKPAKRKYRTSKVITDGLHENFDLDLADMSSIATHNTGVRFLLVLIDMFSRQAFVEPIRNKSGATVTHAMRRLFNRMPSIPKTIRHDAGKEFLNKHFTELMKQKNVETFTTYAQNKANYAERFIRTLKTRIHRYLTGNATEKYVNVLDQIVSSYNNSFHSSIQMAPNNVTQENESELWKKLYLHTSPRRKKPFKYNIGDTVRGVVKKGALEKGYVANWSSTVYIIQERKHRGGLPMYELADLKGKIIKGLFYEQEIQKVKISDDLQIDFVRNTRMKQGRREYLVRWAHLGSSYDDWISEETFNKHLKKR